MILALCWFCSLAHAADWTEHVVPSQFLSTTDFPFAGISLRVEVDGLGPLWLQLDTAVPEAVLLHGRSLPPVPGATPVPSNSSRQRFVASGRIGEHHFRREAGLVYTDLGGKVDLAKQKAGNVGAAAFEGSWLVLDLAEKRIAVLTSPGEALEAASCWVDLAENRGQYVVHVDGFGRLLFDTGSAPHGVLTSRKGFERLTGKQPDASLLLGRAHAFGKPITVLGAPSQVALRAGPLDLGKPLVTRVPEKQQPHPGILGLAAFQGQVIVLDLVRDRLGRVGPCANETPPQ